MKEPDLEISLFFDYLLSCINQFEQFKTNCFVKNSTKSKNSYKKRFYIKNSYDYTFYWYNKIKK